MLASRTVFNNSCLAVLAVARADVVTGSSCFCRLEEAPAAGGQRCHGGGQAPKVEPPPPGIAGTVVAPTPDLKYQGAALLMIDATVLTPVDVIELAPGLYSSELAPIGADGTFELPLPTAEELPAGLLVPAADFVVFGGGGVTCVLAPTVPTANVVQYVVSGGIGFALPAVVLVGIAGGSATIATPTPIDFENPSVTLFDLEVVTWLYADEDVQVTSPVGGCDASGTPFFIDLDLKQGWNQAALSFEVDPVTELPSGVFLNNSAHEDLYFNAIGGF